MDKKELTIRLIVSNSRTEILMKQLIELRMLEKEVEFRLKEELQISKNLSDGLKLECICEAAFKYANAEKGVWYVQRI